MTWRSLFRLVSLFLVTIPATAAWPQGGSAIGSIIGEVRVLRGSFPEQVLVSLQLRGATIASAYTDSEGRFSFNSIPANPYRVVIEDDRYLPASVSVNVRPDLIAVSVINLTLTPRPGKVDPNPPEAHVVSPADLTRTYPKNAVKEFERGVKMESEGKEDAAIEHYRKAVKEAPDFAVAHNNLGSMYVGKSDFPAAEKEFQESIRLASGDSKPYFNMANLMLLAGKLDQAERYLQEGFRRHPDSAFGLFIQGSVLERSGKYADAERALQRALELNPKMTRPHLELVNLYLREGQRANAIAELHKFLQQAPTDPLAPRAREVLKKLEASSSPNSRQ